MRLTKIAAPFPLEESQQGLDTAADLVTHYLLALIILMASSSESTHRTLRTGPKISFLTVRSQSRLHHPILIKLTCMPTCPC
jgi:hypothetical protein